LHSLQAHPFFIFTIQFNHCLARRSFDDGRWISRHDRRIGRPPESRIGGVFGRTDQSGESQSLRDAVDNGSLTLCTGSGIASLLPLLASAVASRSILVSRFFRVTDAVGTAA
jgi:hypothetical protein